MSLIRGVVAVLLVVTLLSNGRTFGDDDVAPIRLIDASAAVCLEVPRFEATWSKLQNSRLLARLKEFPPVQRFLAGPGFQKWTLIDEYARQATGKTVTAHLVGAFSEAVVIAIYLPDGKPPQGVLIAQARDADALKQTLLAWAKLEPEHAARTLEHHGQSYVRRAKSANSTEVVYYTLFGRTIALSDQERLIKQVIEFHEAARAKGSSLGAGPQLLANAGHFRTNRARLPENSAAFLFLNPRSWDKVISNTIQESPDAAWIQPVARSLTAISASLRLDDESVVDLVAEVNQAAVPSAWRGLISSTGPGCDWSQRIPVGAIATISSRLDATALVQAWLTATAATGSDDFQRGRNLLKSVLLGRDFFSEIVPHLMRDWTLSLVETQDLSANQAPVNLLGQFAIDTGGPSTGATVDGSVDNGLQFGMTALGAVISHQRGAEREPVVVETQTSRGSTIRALTGINTWSPAYRINSSVLVVATSRTLLAMVTDAPNIPSAPGKSRLADFESRYFDWATQLAWLDAVRLRSVLAQHRDWIARQVDQDSPKGHDRVLKHLAKVEDLAKVFDGAFLAARLAEDHIHVVFGAALDRSE